MSSLVYHSIGSDGASWPQWVRDLKTASGAYVIREHGSNGRVLYVGSSGGALYDTITRHFQQWKRKKQWWKGLRGAGHDPGLTYSRARCCVAVCLTRKGSHTEKEADLIRRLRPSDNLVEHPDGELEESPF